MKLRPVLILLALAAAVWGFTLWQEQRSQPAGQADDKAQHLVALSDPAQVKAIELSGSQVPRPIRIERSQKPPSWQITAPVRQRADSVAVGRLIDALLQGRVERSLEQPKDLGAFGLDPARYQVTLIDQKGAKTSLLVGDLSPTGKFAYMAPAGGGRAWLVSPKTHSGAAQSLFDLRDKAALDFEVGKVESLQLDVGGAPLKLIRRQGGQDPRWELGDGRQAEPDKVTDLLYQLHGLQVAEYLDQGIKPGPMGLEPAGGRITLGLEGGGSVGLLLGNQAKGDDTRYARRLAGGPALVLKTLDLQRLRRQPDEMVYRRAWRLDRERVARITVSGQGQQRVYKKQKDGWRRSQPPGDAESGQEASLLLWELVNLRWQDILPAKGDYGLDKTRWVIELSLTPEPAKKGQAASPVTRRLSLGQLDAKSGLLAARVDDQTRVLGLKPDLIRSIPGAREAKPAAAQNKRKE